MVQKLLGEQLVKKINEHVIGSQGVMICTNPSGLPESSQHLLQIRFQHT